MVKRKLTFDSRIPDEAALLARLDGLPEERHLEYIRTLAVKGFLQECAESSQHKHELTAPGVNSSVHDKQDRSRGSSESKTEPLQPEPQPEMVEAPADMTLASLKQLVG